MTLILELTPEQEQQLDAKAAQAGTDRETYAIRRLFGDGTETEQTGQSMYDRLMALGVIGAIEGKRRKDRRSWSEIEGFPPDVD